MLKISTNTFGHIVNTLFLSRSILMTYMFQRVTRCVYDLVLRLLRKDRKGTLNKKTQQGNQL